MTSFVNMMANDVWSEADIKARLHAEIRSHISEYTETELNRALQGMAMGLHQLTPQEQANLMLFKSATDRTAMLGIEAREDMALLLQAFAVEAAQARLAAPLVAPETNEELAVTNQPAVDADAAGRADAQAVIDAASPQVLDLCLLRNPAPEPEPVL